MGSQSQSNFTHTKKIYFIFVKQKFFKMVCKSYQLLYSKLVANKNAVFSVNVGSSECLRASDLLSRDIVFRFVIITATEVLFSQATDNEHRGAAATAETRGYQALKSGTRFSVTFPCQPRIICKSVFCDNILVYYPRPGANNSCRNTHTHDICKLKHTQGIRSVCKRSAFRLAGTVREKWERREVRTEDKTI